MKYGVIVYKETENIGDDIQSYAAACLLPEVNYYIEREHLDIFRPEEDTPVNAIINGWLMYNKLGWPISPCINPLYISMHFYEKDILLVESDFLSGLGGDDLKAHSPIGVRDIRSGQLLEENGISSYFSGCLTLTLPQKFKKEHVEPYVCLTDISEEAISYVQTNYPDLNIRVIEHVPNKLPPLVHQEADWKSRFQQVETLLETYQNASAVVTTRIHCALPCLALGTPVLLLLDDEIYDVSRLNGLSELTHNAKTSDFAGGNVSFDLRKPPDNPTAYLKIRNSLIQRVNQFIADNSVCTDALKERFASYDSQWEARAMWKNKILQKLTQKHVEQWINTQKRFEQMEHAYNCLLQEINDLHKWTAELEAGKKWLEQERESLQNWVAELEAGKAWLEQERISLQSRVAELEASKKKSK